MAKKEKVILTDEAESDQPQTAEPESLVKSILNVLNGPKGSIERLAFEVDPSQNNTYAALYRYKQRLIPDTILKRIAIQDDLVASIVHARSNHMSAFGRPRPDRFSTGFVIEPNVGVIDKLSDKEKLELDQRLERTIRLFNTCGNTGGWSEEEKMSLSQWLSMSVRNAVVVGRLATEIVWVTGEDGQRKFHSFRPIDAGTIYRAAPQKHAAESVRKQALALLESVKNKKLKPENFSNDAYSWVQVLDGRPIQAFTAEECVVHNFYPVPDIELDGYPVTPIDTMIAAVTTHINITTHNKMYFQTGRAAKGMLVIKSDDVNEAVINRIKHQFNHSINSVNNAHRTPIFGIGTTDDLTWSPIDGGGSRDMEFQYLTDMNARVILSAFQMSPEELPGWSYLSRGTNSQALSEGNNEYRMQAARDLGIRPLIAQFEDFLNTTIFPLIDKSLSAICRIRLVGLDADTAEKESVRLQQDMPVHMSYDEVLKKVEKQPVGKDLGGMFPLNPQYQAILDKYITVGTILERFFGIAGASKDPSLAYIRDPMWFNFQQMQMQAQQMQQAQAQAQVAQQQQRQGQGSAQGGEQTPGAENPAQAGSTQPGPPNRNPYGAQTEKQKSADVSDAGGSTQDLTRSIDQALDLLTKSEEQLPPSRRRLLARQKQVVQRFLEGWEKDIGDATKEILDIADNHLSSDKK